MYTVGRIARRFDLSRSTLLYYDAIGLLKPSQRSEAGYRLYSDDDMEKLKRIMLYRDMGIPLEEIAGLIASADSGVDAALIKRLGELNSQIRQLKRQQEVILKVMKSKSGLKELRVHDREAWWKLLNAAGIDGKTAWQWHRDFETHAPEQHHLFLKLLGVSDEEIVDFIATWEKQDEEQR